MIETGGKRTFITGQAGSGKSFFAKKLIENQNRVIVFDPEEEYALKGFHMTDDLKEVKNVLQDCWDSNFKITYIPPVGKEQQALHGLSLLVEALQKPYLDGKSDKKTILVVDELNLSFPLNWKVEYDGFARIASRGRKRGINVVGISQRPAEIATRFRANLDRLICFGHCLPNDWQAITDVIGKEGVERAKNLPQFSAIDWQNGSISVIKK